MESHLSDNAITEVLTRLSSSSDDAEAVGIAVDNAIAEVLARLSTNSDDAEAVPVAVEVALSFPLSVRAQYLPIHCQIWMVRNLGRDDPQKLDTLLSAVNRMKTLSSDFPRSLALSFHLARLLAATGNYDAANAECNRAFLMDDPTHPEIHQFPARSDVEEDNSYSDRVLSARNEFGALKNVLQFCQKWGTESFDDISLLCADYDSLVQHFHNDPSAVKIVSDALCQFKENRTWYTWICPFPAIKCDNKNFETFDLFFRHLDVWHGQQVSTVFSSVSDDGLHSTISLSYESGKPIFCFKNKEDLIHSLLLLSSGVKPLSLEDMQENLRETYESFEEQSNGFSEKLLEACVFDYRKALLPLLSSFKWDKANKNANVDSMADFGWVSYEGPMTSYVGNASQAQCENQNQKVKTAEYFDSLNELDWRFADENKDQKANTAEYFDSLVDLDWTWPAENKDQKAKTTDLMDLEWTIPDENKDQKAKTFKYFDSLIDLDWTFPDQNQEPEHKSQAHSLDHGQKSHLESSSPTEKKEMALQLDIMENTTEFGKRRSKKSRDKAQGSGSRHNQAWMYGVHRREKVKPTPSPTTNAPFDPYATGWVHLQYLAELRRRSRHVCSFCFFERNHILEVHEFAHYGREHNSWGIKCNLCPARFVVQSALDWHKGFCHGNSEGSHRQKDMKPG